MRRPSRPMIPSERQFRPGEPDRLYVADITQHRTLEGGF